MLLFLLMQITITSSGHGLSVGVSNPWTEYVKMLPDVVPLPTLWTDDECVMLRGTSLEVCSKSWVFIQCLVFEYEVVPDAKINVVVKEALRVLWLESAWNFGTALFLPSLYF